MSICREHHPVAIWAAAAEVATTEAAATMITAVVAVWIVIESSEVAVDVMAAEVVAVIIEDMVAIMEVAAAAMVRECGVVSWMVWRLAGGGMVDWVFEGTKLKIFTF